ncbi:hypothetical protein BDA99DRAFT_561566 [Phascolomyces articulosus]|uniref:Uncharacterized protein n=1 Tax=Phascolomyces articulosus TaxID=60185 RepID=A0AAD5JX05_9FUNG|nr:hypothetical protein BDA99DRAFT_561566 [Phascolomyces articulosus]
MEQEGHTLTLEEKKVMSRVLSRLINMIDASVEGQRTLFDMNEWESFANGLKVQYRSELDPSFVKQHVLDTWSIITNLCQSENQFEKVQQYLKRIQSADSIFRSNRKLFKVFELILDLEENHPNTFDIKKGSKVTETDHLVCLWIPPFDILLSIDNSSVRLKRACDDTIGWMLQLSGPVGEVSSVHLIKRTFYVAIPEQKIHIPKSIFSMSEFPKMLSSLLVFTHKIQESAYDMIATLQSLEDRRTSIGDGNDPVLNDIPGYQSANIYKNQQSTINNQEKYNITTAKMSINNECVIHKTFSY